MSGPRDPELANVDHITFANLELLEQRRTICPDWRVEHVTSKNLKWLTNDVHPAFEEEHFVGEGFNHAETLMARRFASHLLEADCMLPFWWTLLFKELPRHPGLPDRQVKAATVRTFKEQEALAATPEEKRNAVLSVDRARDRPARGNTAWFREPTTPIGTQIDLTKAALPAVARFTYYQVDATVTDMICKTCWANQLEGPLRGSPSLIQFSPELLSAHSRALREDVVCQAYASISLGIEFVRQFAHAAMAAVRSGVECNWDNQYNFEADEAPGREILMLEACSFGGVFRREQEPVSRRTKAHYTIDGVEGVMGLWFAYSDFAGAHLEEMFGDMPSDEDEQLEQENGPFYHREWQVPFQWLLGLLTDKFWAVDVARCLTGRAALLPPVEVGYVMSRDSDTKHGPYHSEQVRKGVLQEGFTMLPRSFLIVDDDLFDEARTAVLFGGFSNGRILVESVNPEQIREPPVGEDIATDDASAEDMGFASAEDDDD